MNFRVIPDNIDCMSTIYNTKTTSIESKNLKITSIRIDVIDEGISEIQKIIDTHKKGNKLSGEKYTNGQRKDLSFKLINVKKGYRSQKEYKYMPNVNGFDVLEYFKNNNLFKKVPVSIISGAEERETIERAFNYDIVDLLAKPFNERDIKSVIEKTINYKNM